MGKLLLNRERLLEAARNQFQQLPPEPTQDIHQAERVQPARHLERNEKDDLAANCKFSAPEVLSGSPMSKRAKFGVRKAKRSQRRAAPSRSSNAESWKILASVPSKASGKSTNTTSSGFAASCTQPQSIPSSELEQLSLEIRQQYQRRFVCWKTQIHTKLCIGIGTILHFDRYYLKLTSQFKSQLLLEDRTWESLDERVDQLVKALSTDGAEPLTEDEKVFVRHLQEIFCDVKNFSHNEWSAVTETRTFGTTLSYHNLALAFHYQVTRAKNKERLATFFFYSTLIMAEERKLPQVGPATYLGN